MRCSDPAVSTNGVPSSTSSPVIEVTLNVRARSDSPSCAGSEKKRVGKKRVEKKMCRVEEKTRGGKSKVSVSMARATMISFARGGGKNQKLL